MCPAPLYSYFDAQLLADFIMTSQFQEFDTQNSATSGNANQHYDQLSAAAASLSSGYSDYDAQDNARLRKRRMTVTDDRRGSNAHEYSFANSRDTGLFHMGDSTQGSSTQYYHSPGYSQSLTHSAMSSLPIPPSSAAADSQTIADAITEGMTLGDLGLSGSQQYRCGEYDDNSQHSNIMGSPSSGSRYSSRRPQSLRVAVTHSQNESTDPTLATPNMFSPSFMEAMDSGSAVGSGMTITSPSMFYNQATSPYISHEQPQHQSIYGHHHHQHSSSISSTSGHGYSHGSQMGSGIFSNPSNALGSAADDHLGGLQITMNPMNIAAANPGSSAFSRVSNGSDMASQQASDLGLDINTTLTSFTGITGMDGFQAAATDSPYVHTSSSNTAFGTLSSEPSFFNPMGQGVPISGMNPMASPIMSINSPPATASIMPAQQR
ncbi:hypothetical protein EC988_002796, partial [Linderina pennispora]